MNVQDKNDPEALAVLPKADEVDVTIDEARDLRIDVKRSSGRGGHLAYRVVAASAPRDIVLLGGGIQNERPLRGSLAIRYFLAFEKERRERGNVAR